MRRDPFPSDGEENPLDAALGDVQDLAELEQRFALLDARMSASEDDDPFSDIARALREHRASVDADEDVDEDSHGELDDPAQLELSLDSESSSEELEPDPVAEEIEERCQDAMDALDAGDVSLAREIAMAAVRLDDEHPFPMFVLGLIAEHDGDLDTARDMAELSLRTAATNPDAIGLRAHIHVRQHELAEAEDLLRFGIAHNPDEATLHEGLARVSLARGKHEDALRSAGAALRIEPGNTGAIAVRAAALDEGGDRGALLAALRQGVQLHPEDPYAMVELASVEMEHGNLERARMLLQRAQRLAPRDPEISDVRRLVEHVYERPLLRPVPSLLRWMRDFPGGLAGFLVGFIIAALPLHALATVSPDYRVPAISVIAAWGCVALYAWIAPAVLTHRLNQRAAQGAVERLTANVRDSLSTAPTIERFADAISMLVAARDRRGAARLAALAATSTDSTYSPMLEALETKLRGPKARLRAALLAIPALPRLFVAIAAGCAIMAPALSSASMLPVLAWHAIALTALTFAWLLVLVERAWTRDIEDELAGLRLTSALPIPPAR